MRVWLITVGEPLPCDGDVRFYRTGMLSGYLADAGHDVLWWSTCFDHTSKTFRCDSQRVIPIDGRRVLHLIDGKGYQKNVSIERLRDHRFVANRFEELSLQHDVPDVIWCSFPTIELSAKALRYARKNNVPLILDVRDLWPDIFLDRIPVVGRVAGRVLLAPLFRMTRTAFRGCDAVTAVSEAYLDWGLQKGGRRRTAQDRVFPLAYPDQKYSLTEEDNLFLEEIGIDRARPIYLFVGSFGLTYDLAPVISAAKRLGNAGGEVAQFVLCGAGERESEWRRLAGDSQNVVFTGWVSKSKLNALLCVADVGIAAYAKGAPQGVPNKIVEYLAAGLPILSSLDGESRDLIARNEVGYHYDAGDVESLMKAVGKLRDASHIQRISLRSAALFKREYSADVVYSQLANYLEGFADRKRRA